MTKKAKQEPSTPQGQAISKEFTFKLTDTEQLEYWGRAREGMREAEKLKQEGARLNAQRNELLAEVTKLAKEADLGEVLRTVDVIMTKDLGLGLVQFWRKGDGGEYTLLEERAMTGEERQGDLPIEPPHPKQARKPSGKRAPKQLEPGSEDEEIALAHQQETSRRSKRSAVDGAYTR